MHKYFLAPQMVYWNFLFVSFARFELWKVPSEKWLHYHYVTAQLDFSCYCDANTLCNPQSWSRALQIFTSHFDQVQVQVLFFHNYQHTIMKHNNIEILKQWDNYGRNGRKANKAQRMTIPLRKKGEKVTKCIISGYHHKPLYKLFNNIF